MANNQLIVLDDDSMLTITPIVKDADGDIVSKGQPQEVSIGDFIAYLQTKTGWVEGT